MLRVDEKGDENGPRTSRLNSAAIKAAETGKYADGGGLWFHKRHDGGAQWVLRVSVHGRRREMGLGAFPSVTLKEARATAEHWRGMARRGLDPIKKGNAKGARRNASCTFFGT